MNITQTFYDNMASQYDKLFLDWQAATQEQAFILNKLFKDNGFDKSANILDCACGIGTQAIGLASLGYPVTASDISDGEIAEAKERAAKNHVKIRFEHADFRALSETFSEQFSQVPLLPLDYIQLHPLCILELYSYNNNFASQVCPLHFL